MSGAVGGIELVDSGLAPFGDGLHGAYEAMLASLKSERGAGFDRDHVEGQVEYQKGNAALSRNEIRDGSDPDLKQFARETLPKIEDHLQRALKLCPSCSWCQRCLEVAQAGLNKRVRILVCRFTASPRAL
jgi:Domain of unknown function (DUF4142)